jgi:nitroreductase
MTMPSVEQTLALLQGRQSTALLTEPAPTQMQIDQAVAAALTAPDHRRVRPWRFVQITGDRRQAFGDLLVECLLADGETESTQLERIRLHPLRAPVILLCIMHYQAHANVPHVEQVLSCGAAIQNLLLMLQAQGYGSIWRTGAVAQSPSLKQALGCAEQDVIAGMIYLGSIAKAAPEREALLPSDFLSVW